MGLKFSDPKDPPYRSEHYLNFIREKGCICGCDKPPRSEAAHQSFGLRQGSEKVSDTQTIPLSFECHNLEHNWPHHKKQGFWDEKNIDVKMEVIKLQTEYIKKLEEKLYGRVNEVPCGQVHVSGDRSDKSRDVHETERCAVTGQPSS